MSGRIKVKFYLTPILNKERRLNYSTDLLYAGLLRRILNKCYHDDFKEVRLREVLLVLFSVYLVIFFDC